MTTGDADPEDLHDEWHAAKQGWDAQRAAQLSWWRAERFPTETEKARLEQARARFQAAERRWDEAYQAGVVIDLGDDPDGTLARLNAAVTADPLADAPRLAYADAVAGAGTPSARSSSGWRSSSPGAGPGTRRGPARRTASCPGGRTRR